MTDSFKALVIGASRGIGLGVVNELAKRGWQVTATTRGATPDSAPASVEWLKLDINKPAERHAVREVLSEIRFDLTSVNDGVFRPLHPDVTTSSDDELV